MDTDRLPVDRSSAFGTGFEAYAEADLGRLLRLARRLTATPDTAPDLVQETLVRVGLAWRRIDQDPAAYATTVLTRLVWRQERRRVHEWRLLTGRRVEAQQPDPYEVTHESDRLGAAMRGLGARQRAVLVLRFTYDLSVDETARVLGCTTGTVKSQTARGLARLRVLLDEEDGDA